MLERDPDDEYCVYIEDAVPTSLRIIMELMVIHEDWIIMTGPFPVNNHCWGAVLHRFF